MSKFEQPGFQRSTINDSLCSNFSIVGLETPSRQEPINKALPSTYQKASYARTGGPSQLVYNIEPKRDQSLRGSTSSSKRVRFNEQVMTKTYQKPDRVADSYLESSQSQIRFPQANSYSYSHSHSYQQQPTLHQYNQNYRVVQNGQPSYSHYQNTQSSQNIQNPGGYRVAEQKPQNHSIGESMVSNDDFLSLLNGPETPENEQETKSSLQNDEFKVVSLRSLLPKKYEEIREREQEEASRPRLRSSYKTNTDPRKMNSSILEKSPKQEKELSGFDNYKKHFLNLLGENDEDKKIDGEPKEKTPLEQAEAKQILLIKVIAGLVAFILLLMIFK